MSPLVRKWFADRLEDWVNHWYACWRGLTHALGITTEWDPCEIDARYLLDGPAPVSATTVAAVQPGTAVTPPGPPSPAFTGLPGPALREPLAHSAAQGNGEQHRAGEPTFNTMLPCRTCGAHSNAPCVNRYGEATGPHKRRRDAATAAGILGGAS